MRILAVIISAVLLIIGSVGFVQTNTSFKPYSTTSTVINHNYYSVSYSEKYEQAEWIAYKLTSSMIAGYAERKNNFKEDPLATTRSATLADYKGSGYDRGHLCPAADMKISQEAMNESFYMSNMSPQNAGFNRGVWKRLEEKVRYLVESNDSIFSVTAVGARGCSSNISTRTSA